MTFYFKPLCKIIIALLAILIFDGFNNSVAQTISNQTLNNGDATTAVKFPGTGCVYNWVNDNPAIGLQASGSGDINMFKAINTGSSPITATITATPASNEGFAYITNSSEGSVDVINTANNIIVNKIPVGIGPSGVAANSSGDKIYVTNNLSNTVSVINTSDNTVLATIKVGVAPLVVIVSPDDKFVYVTNTNDNSISVISAATNKVIQTIKVGIESFTVYGLCISPDGKILYVTNVDDNTITLINTSTFSEITKIMTDHPRGIILSPDGNTIYATNENNSTVSVFNTVTSKLISTIPVGTDPFEIITNHDGSKLYVINQNSDDVSVINTSNNTIVSTISAVYSPFGISITPDDKFLYVTNFVQGTVTIIDALTNKISSVFKVEPLPFSFGNFIIGNSSCSPVKFTITVNSSTTPGQIPDQIKTNGQLTDPVTFPGAGCVYNWINNNPAVGLPASGTGGINSFTATNTGNTAITATITANPTSSGIAYSANYGSSDVSIINTATNAVIKTVKVGSNPIAVAISPDNTKVYISNAISGDISVISTATNAVISTIPVNNGSIFGIALSPDGSRIYVVDQAAGAVSIINTANNALIATVAVGSNPLDIVVSPDGKHVYVTNQSSSSVSDINTINNKVTTVAVEKGPVGLSISPDGKRLYVTNELKDLITVINTANDNIVTTIKVGQGPYNTAVSPDGSKVYVANFISNTVTVINTVDNSIASTFNAPSPCGLSFSTDGGSIYVTNSSSTGVSVFNTSTNTLLATIQGGSQSYSLGNFITPGSGCSSTPITFTITVNPNTAHPTLTATAATGNITACVGNASVSPGIQQFMVSGTNLLNDVVAVAPAGFEVSTTANGVYGNSIIFTQSGGTVNNKIIYVRSSALAPAGNLSGNVVVSTKGTSESIAVTAIINAPPTVDPVADQIKTSGQVTDPINFTGTGNTFTWTNDIPSIGLAASGSGDISSFTAVNNGSTPVKATITVNPSSIPYVYVGNNDGSTVSIVNTLTDKVVSTIDVGTPAAVAVSPDSKLVYFANSASHELTVVSTETNIVKYTIKVGDVPTGLTVSPDGKHVYVVNGASNSISVIDITTAKVTNTISFGNYPFSVVISPDGSKLYVSNYNSNYVSVISTATNKITGTITVGNTATGAAISADGSRLYITNFASNTVSVVNTATNKVTATINVGNGPYGVALSPDGYALYVTNSTDNTFSTISTATNKIVSTIKTGNSPRGIYVTPDGTKIYVPNALSNNLTIIDAASNTVIKTIDVGQNPLGLGNAITYGTGCGGSPIKFTITINPDAIQPAITISPVTGTIAACEGIHSANPYIQQFTISGSNLTDIILLAAPSGFEISLTQGGSYQTKLTLTPTGGTVNSTVIYVRSSATAPAGVIIDNITATTAGLTTRYILVKGVIDALPTINPVVNQSFINDTATTPINFNGIASNFIWTNDAPAIGLPAGGLGNIPSFTAANTGSLPLIATITVIPISGTGCSGAPAKFTITINPHALKPSIIDFPPMIPTPPLDADNDFDPHVTYTNHETPLIYHSSDPSVVTIIANTLIHVVGPGKATIIITQAGNENYSPAEPAMQDIIINVNQEITFLPLPGKTTCDADFLANATSDNPGIPVKYTSSNTAVATVSPDGIIHITGPGTTTITATQAGNGLFTPADPKSQILTVTQTLISFTNANVSIMPGNSIQLNPVITGDIARYSWTPVTGLSNPAIANPIASPNTTTTYKLHVTATSGCEATSSITVNVKSVPISIPNTFTPNGDNINDTWNIKYLDTYPNCTVKIFTRYGQNVYSSIGYGVAWDGRYNGSTLPTGTYYYIIDLKDGTRQMAGWVALIK